MANTLFDLAQQYLQQGLPDITGIFPPQAATISPPITPLAPVTLDPVGIQTLYRQPQKDAPKDDFDRTGRNITGLFQDLDADDFKTVVRNVYDDEAGEFVPTKLKAFKNLKTGLYQTYDGKNVDATFTTAPGAGILNLAGTIFNPTGAGKIEGQYNNIIDLIKGNRNKIPTTTLPQQGLINLGSRVAEDFEGGGEFSTDITPKTTGGSSTIISPNIDEERGRPKNPVGVRDAFSGFERINEAPV
tara:strand:+ start:257 stop:988 length:732 start_codon:yes stop_codon:yes gene_type:complete